MCVCVFFFLFFVEKYLSKYFLNVLLTQYKAIGLIQLLVNARQKPRIRK